MKLPAVTYFSDEVYQRIKINWQVKIKADRKPLAVEIS